MGHLWQKQLKTVFVMLNGAKRFLTKMMIFHWQKGSIEEKAEVDKKMLL